MTFSRKNPSPRYAALIGEYRTMHDSAARVVEKRLARVVSVAA
jgi:hypothetical protein